MRLHVERLLPRRQLALGRVIDDGVVRVAEVVDAGEAGALADRVGHLHHLVQRHLEPVEAVRHALLLFVELPLLLMLLLFWSFVFAHELVGC